MSMNNVDPQLVHCINMYMIEDSVLLKVTTFVLLLIYVAIINNMGIFWFRGEKGKKGNLI